MKEIKIFAGTCTGFCVYPPAALEQARKWEPDVLAAQGGSADPGAGHMGTTYTPYTGDVAIKRQHEVYMELAAEFNIPFILGFGVRSGTDLRVEHDLRLLNEVLKEKHLKFRIAVISSEISKEYLKNKLEKGVKIRRLGNFPGHSEYLTLEDVDRSTKIVAQMGPEPMMKALDMDVDGVVTGRSLDNAHHMAYPFMKGFDKGLATHLAKTIECGAECAEPCAIRPVLGTLRKDHFLVAPADPEQKCTVMSVAAHAFYERVNPSREENPGGILDISEAKYEQYDERTVKVSGSKWYDIPYTVKLEGGALHGYSTISFDAIRDPILVKQIDDFLDAVRNNVGAQFADIKDQYQLFFHVYGRNGTLGEAEPQKEITSNELAILTEATAKTQDLAHAICNHARNTMNWGIAYQGQLTAGGNLVSPSCIRGPKDMGPSYIYNIWHLLPLEDPCEPFRIRVLDFPRETVTFHRQD